MVTTRERLERGYKRRVDLGNYGWKNRRRMAWLAFLSMIAFTALCFFWVDPDRLAKLDTIITWYYMAAASIVGAYMGFSTYASVSGQESPAAVGVDSEGDDEFFEQADPPKSKARKSLRMRGLPRE